MLNSSVKLYGIELNARAIAWAKGDVIPRIARSFRRAMADAKSLMKANGIDVIDVVFTSAAAMHCDGEIFASAREDFLSPARKAIVHMEFNAWTLADLQNGRSWRKSFTSDPRCAVARRQAESQAIDNLRPAVAPNENSPAFGRAASGLQGT